MTADIIEIKKTWTSCFLYFYNIRCAHFHSANLGLYDLILDNVLFEMNCRWKKNKKAKRQRLHGKNCQKIQRRAVRAEAELDIIPARLLSHQCHAHTGCRGRQPHRQLRNSGVDFARCFWPRQRRTGRRKRLMYWAAAIDVVCASVAAPASTRPVRDSFSFPVAVSHSGAFWVLTSTPAVPQRFAFATRTATLSHTEHSLGVWDRGLMTRLVSDRPRSWSWSCSFGIGLSLGLILLVLLKTLLCPTGAVWQDNAEM